MAAGSLKAFVLFVRMVEVGCGRQGAVWLLHFDAARLDPLAVLVSASAQSNRLMRRPSGPATSRDQGPEVTRDSAALVLGGGTVTAPELGYRNISKPWFSVGTSIMSSANTGWPNSGPLTIFARIAPVAASRRNSPLLL